MTKVYIIMNVLIVLSYPLFHAWRLPQGIRLNLARLVVASCTLGPMVFHVVPAPRSKTIAELGEVLDESVGGGVKSIVVPKEAAAGENPVLPHPIQLMWLMVAVGACMGLYRLGRDVKRIRDILRTSAPLKRIGRMAVVVSDDIKIPLSVRTLRKAFIVLPLNTLQNVQDLRLIVSHEGQHHRQKDCLAVYVQELLRAACWWNPITHLWLKTIGEIQELACDEALVGRRRLSPHDYGSCLVRVARAALSPGLSCAVAWRHLPYSRGESRCYSLIKRPPQDACI